MVMIPVAKPCLNEEDAVAAYRTVLSGWVTQGPRVQDFEEKFANYVGARYAVAVSNCTTALHLAMIVSGVAAGDEVICPTMSFIATANSITYVGARPVFCDIDPFTNNIDADQAERLITDKTKAILIVHQIGMPADIDKFRNLAERYNLKLIEDAACAAGSIYQGAKIGSHSSLVCFSFHPRKVITTGDGGMITTSNQEYYNRLKHLRQHGMSVNDRVRHESRKVIAEEYLEIGYNFRMTDIQAAVGIKQLEKIDWIIARRREIAFKYHEALKQLDCVRLPFEKEGYISNYQSYSVYLKDLAPLTRNDLMQKMLDRGIHTRRGVMTAHREPAYENYCKGLSFPVSDDVADRSIILPLYVPMKDGEVQIVIDAMLDLLS